MKILSFTCEDVGVVMVTEMISQKQVSKVNKKVAFYLEISSVSIKLTEHYMIACEYEFYLLVLIISLSSERSELVRDTNSTRR